MISGIVDYRISMIVDDQTALGLVAALRARLPGYLVPQLVREIAGADSKTAL